MTARDRSTEVVGKAGWHLSKTGQIEKILGKMGVGTEGSWSSVWRTKKSHSGVFIRETP